jgi:hypothetical protein
MLGDTLSLRPSLTTSPVELVDSIKRQLPPDEITSRLIEWSRGLCVIRNKVGSGSVVDGDSSGRNMSKGVGTGLATTSVGVFLGISVLFCP